MEVGEFAAKFNIGGIEGESLLELVDIGVAIGEEGARVLGGAGGGGAGGGKEGWNGFVSQIVVEVEAGEGDKDVVLGGTEAPGGEVVLGGEIGFVSQIGEAGELEVGGEIGFVSQNVEPAGDPFGQGAVDVLERLFGGGVAGLAETVEGEAGEAGLTGFVGEEGELEGGGLVGGIEVHGGEEGVAGGLGIPYFEQGIGQIFGDIGAGGVELGGLAEEGDSGVIVLGGEGGIGLFQNGIYPIWSKG